MICWDCGVDSLPRPHISICATEVSLMTPYGTSTLDTAQMTLETWLFYLYTIQTAYQSASLVEVLLTSDSKTVTIYQKERPYSISFVLKESDQLELLPRLHSMPCEFIKQVIPTWSPRWVQA